MQYRADVRRRVPHQDVEIPVLTEVRHYNGPKGEGLHHSLDGDRPFRRAVLLSQCMHDVVPLAGADKRVLHWVIINEKEPETRAGTANSTKDVEDIRPSQGLAEDPTSKEDD